MAARLEYRVWRGQKCHGMNLGGGVEFGSVSPPRLARHLDTLSRPLLARPVHFHLRKVVRMQSKVVTQLTLLFAITVLHRSCSVAAEPLHR